LTLCAVVVCSLCIFIIGEIKETMTAIENAKTTKADSDSPPPTIDDDSQQLARAHVRFTQSVTKGILTLQRQCGYSRERATTTLLRELSDGTGSEAPTDDEVSFFLFL
jgi:hypothetical protein